MKKMGKRFMAAGLCACLAAGALTGCGSSSDNWDKTAITVNDTTADLSLVNF